MAYILPVFPITVTITRGGVTVATVPCQLRVAAETLATATAYVSQIRTGLVALMLPAHTDIRPLNIFTGGADIVEVPAASGRVYRVMAVDDIAKGFANEHRVAILAPLYESWTYPIP